LGGSWHGVTGGAASTSFASDRRGYGPPVPGVHLIPEPNAYRPFLPGASADESAMACLEFGLSVALRLDARCATVARYLSRPPLVLTSRDTVEEISPADKQWNATIRHKPTPSRSPPDQPATTATNTTHQPGQDASNLLKPDESGSLTETDPVDGLSTAATHQTRIDPTTPHAQQQTTVPQHTSRETSLVQGVATTT
jgi:hypothetical protein